MESQGSFGYKIGNKLRLMHIENHADILWQICVREIYLLMKHYENVDKLKNKFTELRLTKYKPKMVDIEKCKIFTDIHFDNSCKPLWHNILQYCQHSFINILESGYFINNGNEIGHILILDFNTNSVKYYTKSFDGKKQIISQATIDEIMDFEDMPTNTLDDVINNMKTKFDIYYKKRVDIEEEINKLKTAIEKTKELGGEQNIIQKARQLLERKEWDKRKILIEYRVLYNRLDILNLLDHS